MKRVLLIAALLLVVLALFAACGEDAPDLPDTSETPTTETPTPTVYTITYELNGGTNAQSNPATYTESDTVVFANPTRAGYDFAGWSIASIPQGSTENKTVTASWTPINYTITYELGGGENAATNPATYTIESEAISFAEPTRTGYIFAGWSIASIPQGSTENKTVTAQWSAIFEIDENTIAGLTDAGKKLTAIEIPSELDGVAITSIGQNAFKNLDKLTSVTIPNSVTSIGYCAFSGCKKLAAIVIPKGVTAIGNSAFYNCEVLASVTFEDGSELTTLGEEAFEFCEKLTDIVIPKGVKTIGDSAFSSCAELVSIAFEDGSELTTLGTSAFSGCAKLAGIVIPKGVTSIKDQTFQGCAELVSITFEDGSELTTLGTYAFSGCVKLEGIVIPNGATSIKSGAFYSCSALTSVTIPKSIESIADYVFYQCGALADIYYLGTEAKWETVDKGDKWDYSAFTLTFTLHFSFSEGLAFESNGNGTCVLTGIGTCDDTDIVIPPTVNGDTVTAIGNGAFDSQAITSVKIPASVTTIGQQAFCKCTALTSIELPEGVESILFQAFKDCTALTKATIPTSVMTIGDYAFIGCEALAHIYYDGTQAQWDALTKGTGWDSGAGSYKVHYRSSKGLAFQSNGDGTCSVVGIGTCTDTDLVIPDTSPDGDVVTGIGNYAFESKQITSVKIPSTVETIGDSAFSACDMLETVEFEEGSKLTSIGTEAFAYCSALTGITIPKGVQTIESSAFYGCEALETFEFEEDSELTSIGESAFSGCTNLMEITIPASVTSIGAYAFEECSNLANVTFADDSGEWYVTETEDDSDGADVAIYDPADNVFNLTDTYVEYYWYHK